MQLTKTIEIDKQTVVVKEPTVAQIRDLLAAVESGGDLAGLNALTLFGEHWEAVKRRGGELVLFPHGMGFDDLSESQLREIWEAIKELSPFLRSMERVWTAVTNLASQPGAY